MPSADGSLALVPEMEVKAVRRPPLGHIKRVAKADAKREIAHQRKKPGRKPEHGSDIIRSQPERIDTFLATLEFAGNAYVAAARAGISIRSVYNWIGRGQTEPSGILHDFWVRCEKAMANFELRQLGNIQDAANHGDAKASMWLLERLLPWRYMKREQHEHTGPNGGPVVIQVEWPDGARGT